MATTSGHLDECGQPEPAEWVPCPTLGCRLDGEVVRVPLDALMHSRCPAGHDNTLAPPVLEHLRGAADA